MQTVHPELLKVFKDTYPSLLIKDVIAYDDDHGTFINEQGKTLSQRFIKFTPNNLLGGVTPSAFVDEGEPINDAIERALSYSPLKAVKGLDYNVLGNVNFNGNIEQRITVNFSVNSAVFTGSFIVKFYNRDRSGFNDLMPRDLTGVNYFSGFQRIQAYGLSTVFTSDIAILQNGYLSTVWIDALINGLKSANIDVTNVRDNLVGVMASKFYSDEYTDLVDIPFMGSVLTLRYQGSRVTPPFLSYVELPIK